MKNSRHPIWMASISRIILRIIQGDRFQTAHPELPARYRDEGERIEHGIPSRCYEAEIPFNEAPREVYAPQIRICAATITGLFSRFQAWEDQDGGRQLIEDYRFSELKINVDLGDADFDPSNPAYSF